MFIFSSHFGFHATYEIVIIRRSMHTYFAYETKTNEKCNILSHAKNVFANNKYWMKMCCKQLKINDQISKIDFTKENVYSIKIAILRYKDV